MEATHSIQCIPYEIVLSQEMAAWQWQFQCCTLINYGKYEDLYYLVHDSMLISQEKVVFSYDTPSIKPLYDMLRFCLESRDVLALDNILKGCNAAGFEEEYLKLYININNHFYFKHHQKLNMPELNTLIRRLREEIQYLEVINFKQAVQQLGAYITTLCKSHNICAPQPSRPSLWMQRV